MNNFKKAYAILNKEGLINYFKRKLNISYLDNRTTYTIKYNNKPTKILLNRKFGHVDMTIFKDGIYEKEILDDIRTELSSQKIMLDIGSNIGQRSLLMSPYCKQIYAFEPIPEIYSQFKKSIVLNKIKNIQLYNLAIGEKKESKKFNYITNHAGSSSFVATENPSNNMITVEIDTIENVLSHKKFDVIKIDVEGYEAVVIFGNKDIILKNSPTIFMEFGPESIKKEGTYSPLDLFHFFLDSNYEIYSRVFKKFLTKEDESILRNDNWILKPKN